MQHTNVQTDIAPSADEIFGRGQALPLIDTADRLHLATEAEYEINTIIRLYRRAAGLREVMSAALEFAYEQHKQIIAKDHTIGRLRDELRQVRGSRRRAA